MKTNLTVKEIVAAASQYGYIEGGIQTRDFQSKISNKANTLVVAINNGDIAGAYSKLLLKEFEKVIHGAEILGEVHCAEKVIVHIPAGVADLLSEKIAECKSVSFEIGLVNKRNYPDAVFHHIATALNFSEIDDGNYTEGVYVTVNGGEIRKCSPDKTIKEIAEMNGVVTDGVTTVISGYKLLLKSALSQPICEVLPENANVRLITDKECAVKVVAELLFDAYKTSCGKCTFCREGLNQLSLMIEDMTIGKGKIGYIDIIWEIATAMKKGTLCTLGQNCGEVALGLLANENEEVVKHIKRKKCTPGVCFSNDTYYIAPELCNGCAECLNCCSDDAILGKAGYIHMIDDLDCTRCGKCVEKCKSGAIRVTTSRTPKTPDRLTRVGQFRKY